jgi:hypothetical protein
MFDHRDEGAVNVYSVRLSEETKPGQRRNIADAVAAGVAWMLDRIASRFRPASEREHRRAGTSEAPVAQAVTEATRTAVGAYEGKLEGMSLEGEFKRAQIEREYAEARRANAEARKIEVETAGMQLERHLLLARQLNIPLRVVQLPDGTLGIALGERIIGETGNQRSVAHGEPTVPSYGAILDSEDRCSVCLYPVAPNTRELIVNHRLDIICLGCGAILSGGAESTEVA